MAHMFWSCPKISDYWKAISQTLSTVLHKHIALDPLMAVLGIIDSTTVKMKMEYDMVSFVSLPARRLILLDWKQRTPPVHTCESNAR